MVGSNYVGNTFVRYARWVVLGAATLVGALTLAAPVFAAGSPPEIVHATRVGAAPEGESLPLIFPLKADSAGLKRFATAVSTPASPFYGQYLSVAELARRFGASAQTRARVLRYLRASGATDVRVDATGLLAEANMSVGLAQRLFAAPIEQFRAASRGRFVAPAAATSLPGALRGLVDGVVGLDTEPAASPEVESAKGAGVTAVAAQSGGSALERTGTPGGCPAGVSAGGPQYPGFTPNQYLTAYDFAPLYAAGYKGQGERVALIEIDGYDPSDVSQFAQCFGLTLPPITPYSAGVSNALAPGEEATLDLEILAAAAPELKAIDVYESNARAEDTLAAFAYPLENPGHKPQVISASLGLCEVDTFGAVGKAVLTASEKVLELAAASGVSVLASSGDNGSADCETPSNAPADALAVNYPASSWWVTGVGGTNLSLNADNTIATQPVWNDEDLAPAGGGGGSSVLFQRPPYQNGIVAGNHRAVPDVSMLADLLPGYVIYCTASPDCINQSNSLPWQTVGGTSAGTPLLAGGVAIVDEMLATTDHENLGLLNPLLYKLGTSALAASVFSDVTSGSNDIGPFIPGGNGALLGCCTATTGYDEASGWGSVQIAGFASAALALVPKRVAVSLKLPKRQRPVVHRELLATVSCSAACSMAAFASVKIGSSKPFEVGPSFHNQRAKGHKTIAVKFSAKQLRNIRSALAHHRKVEATVYGAQLDNLGDIEHNTGGKRLRISG